MQSECSITRWLLVSETTTRWGCIRDLQWRECSLVSALFGLHFGDPRMLAVTCQPCRGSLEVQYACSLVMLLREQDVCLGTG